MTTTAIRKLNSKNSINSSISASITNSVATSSQHSNTGRLEARWMIEDDKLVCKWVIV